MKQMKPVSFSVRTGQDFEGRMVEAFHSYALKNGTEKYFVCTANTDLDLHYGTDVIVDGIPVDVTCCFSRKKDVIKLSNTIDVKGQTIYFGIRTGNSHITFPNPVVVVGIDEDMHYLNTFMENICDSISDVICEIMDMVNDIFYQYCDDNGIEPIDYTKYREAI